MSNAMSLADSPRNGLMAISKAKQLLATCDIDQAIDLRDKAAAMASYLKARNESYEVQCHASEIKLRAERKAGELLAVMEKRPPGPRKDQSQAGTDPQSLEDMGINKNQSSRWQEEAKVPEEVFEEWVEATKEAGKELTQSGLISVAKKLICDDERERAAEVVAAAPPISAGKAKSLSDKFMFVFKAVADKSMKRKDALLKVGMKQSEYAVCEKVIATEDETLIKCMNDGRISLAKCKELAALEQDQRDVAIVELLDAKAIASNKNRRTAARTMSVIEFCISALNEGRLSLLSLEDQAKDWACLGKCDAEKLEVITSHAKAFKKVTDRVVSSILEGVKNVSER